MIRFSQCVLNLFLEDDFLVCFNRSTCAERTEDRQVNVVLVCVSSCFHVRLRLPRLKQAMGQEQSTGFPPLPVT